MNEQKSANQFTRIKHLSLAALLLPLVACGGGGVGGNSQAADPTIANKPIAYVKRPTPTNAGTPVSGDVTNPETFIPGAHLIIKMTASVSSPEIDITNALIGNTGDVDVRDPAFSDDGTKLLFSLHKKNVNGQPPETWNIYEYDLTQPVSSSNPALVMDSSTASTGDDIEPQFIPGNRIIFSSTRGKNIRSIEIDENTASFAPTVEQVNSKRHSFNLHSMALDGSDIKQLSHNMSDDLYPTVIRNIPGLQGRILFARWEHSPGKNQMSLYTMNPDGTDVQILYGEKSHNTGANNSQIQFTQPRETSAGDVVVIARQFTGTFDGGDPMQINVSQYVDNTVPVNASSGLAGPAETSLSNYMVLTSPGISLAGRFNSIIPLQDGTNRALVSYSLCYVNVLDTTTNTTTTHACSDPSIILSDPNTTEAPPRYGVFIYSMGDNTVVPITPPQADTYYTDVALAQDLPVAPYIADKIVSTNPFGVLDIRSVYDMDGSFNDMGSGATLAQLSDPAQSTGDIKNNPTLIERPARFLRIVKGVYLPDSTVQKFKASAYGVSTNQLMRQVIGYAPIDPDGSVRVEVPANVPLSISILDKYGQRIGNRHDMWLTVRPGETLSCAGCHDPASSLPHGRAAAQFPSINPGAPTDGYVFPNTAGSFVVNAGDTMAEARTRTQTVSGTNPLEPTPDIVYSDAWTDTAVRALDAPFAYSYASLNTPSPANAFCTPWNERCRITINYETDIHPLWALARKDVNGTDVTCINCHTNNGTISGQLNLTDGVSVANPDWFNAYEQLLATHDQVDATGNVVLVDSGQVDSNGNPILVPATVPASMVAGAAAGSGAFFNEFTNTHGATTPHCTVDGAGVCQPWLSVHELKLLSEWVDIGAQYYNNPFDAPTN